MPFSVKVEAPNGERVDRATGPDGAFRPGVVKVQFLCTTGDGGHDPAGSPDDRVRPHHAALHGTVWDIDDISAPIPPLDYGCRCAIRYITQETAAPGLPTLDLNEPTQDSAAGPYRLWLDKNASGWQAVARVAAAAQPQERAGLAYLKARALGLPNPRDIVRMAIEASPYPMTPLAPLGVGPLAGIGPAARRLVALWRAGNVEAADKLRRSYPATFARLLAEEPGLVLP